MSVLFDEGLVLKDKILVTFNKAYNYPRVQFLFTAVGIIAGQFVRYREWFGLMAALRTSYSLVRRGKALRWCELVSANKSTVWVRTGDRVIKRHLLKDGPYSVFSAA